MGGVYTNPQTEPSHHFHPKNRLISRFASVSQSSTQGGLSFDGVPIDVAAEKAVDGNLNGRENCQLFQRGLLPVGSFSQTQRESEPWYELDFGEDMQINYIDLWNTVELNGNDLEPASSHMRDVYILISEKTFGNADLAAARTIADTEYHIPASASPKRRYTFNELKAVGRYVRIQAAGRNMIKLAEVEVIGRPYVPGLGTRPSPEQEIKVWPNPTKGTFNIELPEGHRASQVRLYDSTGKLVFL